MGGEKGQASSAKVLCALLRLFCFSASWLTSAAVLASSSSESVKSIRISAFSFVVVVVVAVALLIGQARASRATVGPVRKTLIAIGRAGHLTNHTQNASKSTKFILRHQSLHSKQYRAEMSSNAVAKILAMTTMGVIAATCGIGKCGGSEKMTLAGS